MHNFFIREYFINLIPPTGNFRVEKHPTDSGKLVLTINRQPIGEWFKEQWEKLQQTMRPTVQEEKKSRGFRM